MDKASHFSTRGDSQRKAYGKETLRSILPSHTSEGKKINLAFRLYRFTSLFLTAALFVSLSNQLSLSFRLLLVIFLLVAAAVLVYFYEKYQQNRTLVTLLIITEVAGLTYLLSFSGGLESPFLWYSLNPFFLAAVHLSYYWLWFLLATFFSGILWLQVAVFSALQTTGEILANSIPSALTMTMILLIMQVFSRLYLLLSEQSSRLELQKKELFTTYRNLSHDHYVFQNLSQFQKEAVACQDENDIFKTLTRVVTEVFPLIKSAIMVSHEPLHLISGERESFKQVITPQGNISEMEPHHREALDEILQRSPELTGTETDPLIISNKRHWMAIPLHTHNKSINAIFIGWLKPGVNPFSFMENLLLFIKFTEQAGQRLYIFKQNEHTLQQLSSLYSAVEAVSSLNSTQEVTDLFAAYGRAMTGCEKLILWMNIPDVNGGEAHPVYSVKGKKETFPEEDWQKHLLHAWSEMCRTLQPATQYIYSSGKKGQLVCVPVKSGSHSFGLLAALRQDNHSSTEDLVHTLSILGDLCAIALERNLSEVFADKLLVLEEQNRIAGEIHDNISQNIFSMVYSLDALYRETSQQMGKEHRERLFNIRNLASETARELRLLIYRLSPRKRGDNTFLEEISSYLEGLARLNQLNIQHEFAGKEEYLNPAIRNAFYRIIKEATGNSIRHGESKDINIQLEMNPFRCDLKISDNGKGFQVKDFYEMYTSSQLGMVNMRELALSLQGTLDIHSEPGEGTVITCSVPTSPLSRGSVSN